MRISDWSSDVCSSDLAPAHFPLWIHRLLTAADVSISYFVYIRRLSLLSCDRLRGRNNSRAKGESNDQGFLQKADSVSSRVYDDIHIVQRGPGRPSGVQIGRAHV